MNNLKNELKEKMDAFFKRSKSDEADAPQFFEIIKQMEEKLLQSTNARGAQFKLPNLIASVLRDTEFVKSGLFLSQTFKIDDLGRILNPSNPNEIYFLTGTATYSGFRSRNKTWGVLDGEASEVGNSEGFWWEIVFHNRERFAKNVQEIDWFIKKLDRMNFLPDREKDIAHRTLAAALIDSGHALGPKDWDKTKKWACELQSEIQSIPFFVHYFTVDANIWKALPSKAKSPSWFYALMSKDFLNHMHSSLDITSDWPFAKEVRLRLELSKEFPIEIEAAFQTSKAILEKESPEKAKEVDSTWHKARLDYMFLNHSKELSQKKHKAL